MFLGRLREPVFGVRDVSRRHQAHDAGNAIRLGRHPSSVAAADPTTRCSLTASGSFTNIKERTVRMSPEARRDDSHAESRCTESRCTESRCTGSLVASS